MEPVKLDWVWDVLALVGLALVLGGCWWIYPPVALIVGGVALVAFSLWASRAEVLAQKAMEWRGRGR
jgi:hypothetical protein